MRSHSSYALGLQLVVVGELLNGAANDVFGARVKGRFYNSSGDLIATAEVPSAFGKLEIERTGPFRLIVDVDPAAVSRYELSVSFEEISINEYREPDVSAVEVVERNGHLVVIGQLHNGQEMGLSSVVGRRYLLRRERGGNRSRGKVSGRRDHLSPAPTSPLKFPCRAAAERIRNYGRWPKVN